mgnify:CR=1 FL=1
MTNWQTKAFNRLAVALDAMDLNDATLEIVGGGPGEPYEGAEASFGPDPQRRVVVYWGEHCWMIHATTTEPGAIQPEPRPYSAPALYAALVWATGDYDGLLRELAETCTAA